MRVFGNHARKRRNAEGVAMQGHNASVKDADSIQECAKQHLHSHLPLLRALPANSRRARYLVERRHGKKIRAPILHARDPWNRFPAVRKRRSIRRRL